MRGASNKARAGLCWCRIPVVGVFWRCSYISCSSPSNSIAGTLFMFAGSSLVCSLAMAALAVPLPMTTKWLQRPALALISPASPLSLRQ